MLFVHCGSDVRHVGNLFVPGVDFEGWPIFTEWNGFFRINSHLTAVVKNDLSVRNSILTVTGETLARRLVLYASRCWAVI